MPFVKLDCGMLNSTLWFERLAREIFITSLLMAEPCELFEEEPQIAIGSLDYTGWKIPPGKYGFVPAASVGIIRRAMIIEDDIGPAMKALEMLGNPEESSRTQDFDGRRLVRVDGGFIVLNYYKYRDRDYTAAARQARYRERQRAKRTNKKDNASHGVTGQRNGVTSRQVTQAEAEAEAEAKADSTSSPSPSPKKEKGTKLNDKEFLEQLANDPTYAGIDVKREFGKAGNWCKVHNRNLTQRMFVGWLNRAEKPMQGQPKRFPSLTQGFKEI
jgi:hypothetical protein